MKQRSIMAILAVGATCAVAGAAVSGVASSSAATKATAATKAAPAGRPGRFDAPGGPRGPHGRGPGPGRGGIHSESVVPDKDGSGFVTIVEDAGTLGAIDGTKLTLKEGTAKEAYATVDVTADGTVTVHRNGATVKLADLQVGDHVHVSKDGSNTRIDASTAAWEAKQDAAHGDRPGDGPGVKPTWPAA
jgi:hypothetical protein